MSVLKIKDGTGTWQSVTVIKGEDGADGKSAYQIALDNGFEGTEQEWLDSLKSTEVEVDLSNYYTKTEVDEAISNADIDLDGYAKLEGAILDTTLEEKGITKVETTLPTIITYDGYSMIHTDGSTGTELFVNVSGTNLLNDYKSMQPIKTDGSAITDYFIMGGGDPETQQKITDTTDTNYGKYLIPIHVYSVAEDGTPYAEATTYNLILDEGLDAMHYVRFTATDLQIQNCGLDDVLSAYNDSFRKCVNNYEEQPDEWLSNVLQAADNIYRNGTTKGDDGLSAYEVYVKNTPVAEAGIREVQVGDTVIVEKLRTYTSSTSTRNKVRCSVDVDAFTALATQYMESGTADTKRVSSTDRNTNKTVYLDCYYFDLFYMGNNSEKPELNDGFFRFVYEPYGAYSDMAYTWRVYSAHTDSQADGILAATSCFLTNRVAYESDGTAVEAFDAYYLGSNTKVLSIHNPFTLDGLTVSEENIDIINQIAKTIHLNVGSKSIMTEEEWLESLKGGGGTVDLTGYATEAYVQEQISAIEIPTTDLTGYLKYEVVTSAPTTQEEGVLYIVTG